MNSYIIRPAEERDAKAVHDIYGEYVGRNDVTFTEINPDVEHYREKIAGSPMSYPFYVAEDKEGNILGYCCGSRLRPHDAYRWNVEATIMLSGSAPRRQGIGKALYSRFIDALRRLGYQYVYGVLVDTNTASIALHESLGFREVGRFAKAGYMRGEWLGIIWMQKYIGVEGQEIHEPIPFGALEQ